VIFVDDRVGSKELVKYFDDMGIRAELSHLDAGDVCWVGEGSVVGVERKTVSDFVNSCLSGRLGEQLVKMKEDYDVAYLLIEGRYKEGRSGVLLVPRRGGWWELKGRKFRYSQFLQMLSTAQIVGGMNLLFTEGVKGTVRVLCELYKWWRKPPEKHRSCLPQQKCNTRRIYRSSIEERIAAQIPGIGFEKARVVAKHFGCVWNMVTASEEEWMEVEGVGRAIAKSARRVFGRRNHVGRR